MKKIGIIGLGLIGGSMAIDLKRKGYASHILGVEKDPVNASAAERIGLVDAVVSIEDCVKDSDVIIVSVPVGAALRIVPQVLDIMAGIDGGSGKVLMDVCSTKESLASAVKYHPMRKCYVASHPMSGTEYSGPWAALPGLFDGRACIICDFNESHPAAVSAVEEIYDVLNMRVVYMNSSSHDVHTAYVSHFSHVISFALALTVLEKEKDEKHIFDLASGGFSSTVRLAKSGADMWTPILLQNRENVLHVMETYTGMLEAFRKALEESDEEAIRKLIEDANRIKRIIR
ncbi:MAG: prephenate dehydrogenase [Bacteroidales bacterium]|jgi:prephenate dehydrogenase|nr:prephenate dehydrogenase [Bacteroidales bacterium]